MATADSMQEDYLNLHARFFSGLANPTRLQIVELLLDAGELSVGELVEHIGCSQGQISNQLACLKWCGYVASRQEGRRVYYRVADSRIKKIIKLARTIVRENAEQIQSCTRM